jgi:hypothetical protein
MTIVAVTIAVWAMLLLQLCALCASAARAERR